MANLISFYHLIILLY